MSTFESSADVAIDGIQIDQRDIYGTPVLPDLLVRSEMALLRMKSWKRLCLHQERADQSQEAFQAV